MSYFKAATLCGTALFVVFGLLFDKKGKISQNRV